MDVFPTRIFFQGFPSIFQALSYGSWFFQDGFEKGTQDFVALLESRLTGAGEDDEDEEDEEADEEGDDEDGVGTKKSPKIPFCYAMNFILWLLPWFHGPMDQGIDVLNFKEFEKHVFDSGFTLLLHRTVVWEKHVSITGHPGKMSSCAEL